MCGAGEVNKGWIRCLSDPSAWEPRVLLRWDINKHTEYTASAPTGCSGIFLKASREVFPSGIQKRTLLIVTNNAHQELEENGGGSDRMSQCGKLLKTGDSGRHM